MASFAFDLELFTELNQEYAENRLVKAPRQFDPESQAKEAQGRGDMIEKTIGAAGRRLLEVGCGRAGVGKYLATTFNDSEVVGIDVTPFDDWDATLPPNLSIVAGDISDSDLDIGSFDVIYSFSVWEHLVHPYSALANCYDRLAPGGTMFIQAQLHRGPRASHRYREVFFPWPHLLFTPDVFEAYYRAQGKKPMRPAWVNKLTYSQYLDHFARLGYAVRSCRAKGGEFDEAFYQRFHEALSAYPKWDLAHDAIVTVLEKPVEVEPVEIEMPEESPATNPEVDRLQERVSGLEDQLERLHNRKSLRGADWVGHQLRRLTRR